MILTAANSPLQKRTEEAVRFALERTLGRWGKVYASATNAVTITVYFEELVSALNQTLTVGDSIVIGAQTRTITAISGIFPSVPQRYSVTLSAAVTVTAEDVVYVDYSENVRRSDDMRSREAIPWMAFVQVVNLKQDDPGSDYYTGTLVVTLHSLLNTITAEDGRQVTDSTLASDIEPHDEKAAKITAALNDPAALWDLVKPGAANRPVEDIGIMAIHDAQEPGQFTVEGTHNFEQRRKINIVDGD